ncbi:hypothetical protein [Streptomyces radiopugnans]|uniref:Uncharacterized protein n=1 Tax=Streptomyces radiopugnans TaxID=403935 RepID=A0A1H9HXF7_9ACTN|nr:hypothetical protein [Streptomyces radiopugnans]SEQ66885.1 hypothetical protein SAMN05216481_11288 [Streptomyces radiopugnans]
MRADDRYDWLDEETAERLLRGRSAHPPLSADDPGASALAEALERLAAVPTTAAATAGPAAVPGARDDGELPGEAAALAAFRAARVRPGAVAAERRGRLRSLGRPLRVGLAALALGGVLGGVAIAAGSGVLPAPFGGGNGSPAPATSVSAEPDGLLPPPAGTADSLSGRPGADGGREGEERGGPGAPGEGDPAGAGPGGRSAESGSPVPGRDGAGDRAGDPTTRSPQAEARLEELCEKFLDGELGRRERAELERALGGPDRVEGHCRRSGAAAGGADGGAGGGSASGGSSGGSTSGGSTSGGSSGGSTPGGSSGGSSGTGDSAGPATGGQDGTGDGAEGGDAVPEESGDTLPGEEGGDTFPADTGKAGPTGPAEPGGLPQIPDASRGAATAVPTP